MIGRTLAQRELLRFFLTVVALEVVAIGIFYAAGIEHASKRVRTTYMFAWMAITLVIVPTYNEVGNVESLVAEIQALSHDLHILFVDDNSMDGTR